MFTSIGMDNFEAEIGLERRPVLLACIRRGFGMSEQIRLLEEVSKKHAHSIKICLLYEGFNEPYHELGIDGTPTFILFLKGEEKGRMLGKVTMETLSAFILEALWQGKGDPLDASFKREQYK